MNECLPYLSKNDIPDLHVCEKLKQVDLLLFCLGYEDLTDNSCNRTGDLTELFPINQLKLTRVKKTPSVVRLSTVLTKF